MALLANNTKKGQKWAKKPFHPQIFEKIPEKKFLITKIKALTFLFVLFPYVNI